MDKKKIYTSGTLRSMRISQFARLAEILELRKRLII